MAYRQPARIRLTGVRLTGVRLKTQQGSAFIEFGLVMSMLVPLFFGMVILGMSFTKALQIIQFNRDMAHMYAMGLDFSSTSAQSLTTQMQLSSGIYSPGNTVLILSQIKKVYQADCDAQSMTSCPNLNQQVFVQRLLIGTSSLRASSFGTPASTYINSLGNIAPSDYLTQSSLVVTSASTLPAVGSGDSVWVAESYLSLPSLSYLTPLGVPLSGVYTVNFF